MIQYTIYTHFQFMATQQTRDPFFFFYFNPPVQLREPLYKKHTSFFCCKCPK